MKLEKRDDSINIFDSRVLSWPSILTEDEGILYGEDDCKCGQNGKYFKVLGRIEQAEIRGCSDTFSA